VKDTGQGVAPEIHSKLFEPFFTTKAHGTGLGLATSQQIIFEHNGHLVVESQAGKGATFSILLPL
jgi:signal transduction histidine kinase